MSKPKTAHLEAFQAMTLKHIPLILLLSTHICNYLELEATMEKASIVSQPKNLAPQLHGLSLQTLDFSWQSLQSKQHSWAQ